MRKYISRHKFFCLFLTFPLMFLVGGCGNQKGTESYWANKTFISLGDSITWQDGKAYTQGDVGAIARGYQTILFEELKFSSYQNEGVSGRPMADGTQNGVGTVTTAQFIDFSKHDVCIIAVGTNDFKLNVPMGVYLENGEYNVKTFYGAYQTTVEYILNQNENIKICLFTPIQRNNSGYSTTSTNTVGHKLLDYVNAIKDIAEKYALDVCDMYYDSGIVEENLSIYTMDGLHPNDEGYKLMGKCAVNFFKTQRG